MKQFYPLATLLLTVLLLSTRISAQTYTGGTYTAQRTGNWTDNIWAPAQPPSSCINCLIMLTAPGTVTLNTNVTLSNGSKLVIGGNSTGTTLLIGNSNAITWTSSYNIILSSDGVENDLVLADNTEFLNTSNAGVYDGVLQSSLNGDGSTTYVKEYGISPLLFNGTAARNEGNAAYGTTQLGPVTLSSIGTLPIILSDFNAVLNNNQVDLTWTTDLEVNSDHFAVQRSTDGGSHWETLGTVAAKGTSSVSVDYSYTDANPASGVSEYRLQLVDRDGKSAYSTIRTIRTGQTSSISIFPNPAKDYVNITLGGEATTGEISIRLLSQSGQVLVEKKVSNGGGATVTLSVSSYPQGNYLILVTRPDGTQQVNKLLISK